MRLEWLAGALVLATAFLVGCGDDESVDSNGRIETEHVGAKPTDAPAESAGVPWHVVMTFEIDVERARKARRIAADVEKADVLAQVVEVVRRRLRVAEVGEHGVKISGDSRFEAGFAALEIARRDEVADLITRHGTLEFLIEVRPDEEYEQRSHSADGPPRRTGLWPGTAAEFGQFKRDEAAVWKRAQDAGMLYVPTRPGFRLVRKVKMDGSDPKHFRLLEVPPEAQTFDGRMVRKPAVTLDIRNRPVVVFEIATAWQNAFGDWTASNIELPLALVLDGECSSAPVIRARLTTHVQVTLGSGPPAQVKREAQALAAVLEAGALPLRPALVSIVER